MRSQFYGLVLVNLFRRNAQKQNTLYNYNGQYEQEQLLHVSLKLVPKGSININPAPFQKMAWPCAGNKPLSEPMLAYVIYSYCQTSNISGNIWEGNKIVDHTDVVGA